MGILIVIVLVCIAAVLVLWVLVSPGRGLMVGGMLAFLGGRSIFRFLSGTPRDATARRDRGVERTQRIIRGEPPADRRRGFAASDPQAGAIASYDS